MAVSIVSLGPGNPELVTLGAWRTLRTADVVFCPATRTPAGGWLSRAGEVLAAVGIPPQKVHCFELPMSSDRRRAAEAYAAVADAVAARCGAERVAVAAEGDADIYSSVHYVGDLLLERGVAVRYEAGIPALIAAGALAGLHLVSGDESLLLLPRLKRAEELLEPLAAGRTVAVMKLSRSADALRDALRAQPAASWHYFENVGTPGERHLTSAADILRCDFPYFSLLVVKGNA